MTNNYREGELKAIEELIKQGYEVKDQTNNPDYFRKDIDLTAEKNDELITVEVKWDKRISETGNMYVETITDRDCNEIGWYYFCKADYMYYGDAVNRLFYIFKMDDLKEYIKTHHHRLERRRAGDWNIKGQLKKVSEGIIVPINDFKLKYPVEVLKLL